MIETSLRRWFVWNVIFRLQETLKGHPTFQILKEMEAADRLSAAELEALRNRRLGEFIAYCCAHVPYVQDVMRQAGTRPSEIREPGDLARLPIMTKADARKNRDRLRSGIAGGLASVATGGSTGEPLMFDLAKRRIGAQVACRQRAMRWWALSLGDPEVAVWGSPLELTRQDWLRSMRDRIMATRLFSAFEMDEATMSRYLDVLERSGARQIFGYPSSIYHLCMQARKEGRNLRHIGIRAAFVTSEVLFPYQREAISETFGCPVANGYGGRDSGFISHECPQGGMHVMADAMIVEIVDAQGRVLPAGETGEIVVTDLYSHEAPFLRYATGDVGALSDRRCPCGRPLPLFERIEGRSNDSIVTPDGRVMHSLSLIYILREIPGVERYRIRQKAVDCFQVQIVPNEGFHKEAAEEQIARHLSERLRAPLEVRFEYVANLPQERSGKFRHVVSDLAAELRVN